MKSLQKLCFSILAFLAGALPALAQDHMYSQFFDAPVYLNPALNGQFDGDLRVNMIYRNQYTTAPGNLNYYTGSVDLKIPQFGGGVGLMFTHSSEGSASLIKNNIAGVYSYSVGSQDFVLSFGLQAGITNRAVDYSKLVFSDQIDSRMGYIPGSTSSAEALQFNSKYFFDSGFGTNLVIHDWMIGAAVQHINQPNESFTGITAKLPMRFTAHASYRLDLNGYDGTDGEDHSFVIPSVVVYKQSISTAISAGMQYKHKGVNVGMWYRNNGAEGPGSFVLSLIFDFHINKESGEKVRLGVDHDMSFSGLNYSNTSGTTEGSLGYEVTLPNRNSYDKFDRSKQCYHFY
jgi:type IX secretion system PorP/SprF family membrane protein